MYLTTLLDLPSLPLVKDKPTQERLTMGRDTSRVGARHTSGYYEVVVHNYRKIKHDEWFF